MDEVFRSWAVDGEPIGHLAAYVDDSLWRFLHTWALVRSDSGSCLELGANPYFTTYLLSNHTELDVTLANFYGQAGQEYSRQTVSHHVADPDERIEAVYESRIFNIEEDVYPFETNSFDVVLFCEILEHLLMNPLAALREIHRVLKPNGVLVLTTPNVCRLQNALAMVNGANIYDPYSGFGPYGRHNREYNRHELHRLLEFAGFDVERSFTADGHPAEVLHWPQRYEIERLLLPRREDLGQYLFVRARAARTPSDGLPSFLYRSYPPEMLVEYQ
jgi:SAM-dependent methyltransferase